MQPFTSFRCVQSKANTLPVCRSVSLKNAGSLSEGVVRQCQTFYPVLLNRKSETQDE